MAQDVLPYTYMIHFRSFWYLSMCLLFLWGSACSSGFEVRNTVGEDTSAGTSQDYTSGGEDTNSDAGDPENDSSSGGSCPTVKRGASAITVIRVPAPCNDGALWSGWQCATVESTANNNGVKYLLEARWNLVGQSVRGSWLWLAGGSSDTFFRAGQNLADQLQDDLSDVANQIAGAVTDEVRSIETRFVNGRGLAPENGDINLAVVYADLVHWLVDNGIAEGVVGFFGSSAGSVTGAMALAHHGLEEIFDGAIFGAGPTYTDLEIVCDPGSAATDRHRDGADSRTWFDNWPGEPEKQTPCALNRPDLADPSFDCMSILGSEADSDYPNTTVNVLIGENDSDFVYIESQSRLYHDLITAKSKSYETFPGLRHNILKDQAGIDEVLKRIRAIVSG